MAQQAMPWEEFQAPQPTRTQGQGVVIPAKPEKPEQPPAPPSGYRFNAQGGLELIPGGPADPNRPGQAGTESEAANVGFYIRAVGANRLYENQGVGPRGIAEENFRERFPNIANTLISGDERQVADAAQEAFVEAVLRSDSGAAVPPPEIISGRRRFFPQPGDREDVIAAKKQLRDLAIAGVLARAGTQAPRAISTWNELLSQYETEAPAGTEAAPAVAPINPGEAFYTEADLAAQRQLQDAWDRGLSVDEIIQLSQQLGREPFAPEDIARMRDARSQNRPMSFRVNPSGQPTATQEAVGSFLQTPVGENVGGFTMGLARGLTAEMLDEIAPIIGLSTEQFRAARDYIQKKAEVATVLGGITGAVAGALPAIKGAQGVLAGSRLAGAAPLIGETLFGAATGAGAADEGNRALGALIGGGSAAVGGALANRFLPGGPGTFTGIVRGAPPAGRFGGEVVPPQQIIEGGREAGIPIMTSDIRPPETFMGKVGQQVGEIVPFGTAGRRRTQQKTREEAVETLLADAGITIDSDIARDIVTNLTQKRAADIGKYTDMKREVIKRFASAGDVPAPKSLNAIDNLIAKLEAENLPRQLGPLIQNLRDAKISLSGPGNLNKIEDNRATLFGLKSDPGLANIATKTEKAWDAVYKALNDDMGDFIKANGSIRDFNRWKIANTKLAMMAGELGQGGLKRVLDKGDFDPSTVLKMLTSSNPQEVRLLFTNLGREGRANARLLLLQDAAKKASDPNTRVINPNTFAREVGRLKSNFGQFFGGAEAKRVKGLVAALNATRRAQEAQFAPRTGERLMPFATAGSFGYLGTLLGFDPLTGLATSATVGAARQLYESAPVRDLLLKIGNAAGSERARLIADLTQRLSAASATAGAAQAVAPEPGVPEGAIMVGPQQ